MKLDFSSFGMGGGGGSPAAARIFDTPPAPARRLDDASGVIRIGLIAAALFFGALILFSTLVPLSGAAVANGEVTTSGSRVVIQPQRAGVVAEMLVHEGQAVRAGQPLVRMNGVRSAAAAQQAQAKRDGLRALQARLIAERDGAAALNFPTDLTRRSDDPHIAALMATQTAIFDRHREVLRAERSSAATEEASASAQRQGASRQLALIRDELKGMRQLYQKGYARLTQVRALERAAADLQAQTATGSAAVARSGLESARLRSQQVMGIATQLGQVEEQLAQVDPALRVTRYDADRDLLRAPVAGRVSGLARVGPGSVVGGGSTLMEVVPAGRALIVEAVIRASDIDDVRVGSPATLRFTTINPRSHGSFGGHVLTLSPAPVGESGQPGGYRAQIALDDPAALTREKLAIQPGIPVSVQVRTHERTLFNYLLAPIADTMSRAFREE